MASVYQKRGVWYAGFKDGTGKRRLVRTTALTKTEAKRLALELERSAERQRLGLEQLPTDSKATLGELCEWWLANCVPPRRQYNERKRLQRHVLDAEIGHTPVRHLTPDQIRAAIRDMERKGLSPGTINRIRGALYTVFSKAPKSMWAGTNPIAEVDALRVPKKLPATLKADEVAIVLPHVPEYWRGVVACAVYTALRKGEVFGLLKRNVDLKARLMSVEASYDELTTKGKRADIIPIPEPLVPFLSNAMSASNSDYVFPDPKGRMRSPEADPEKVLRRALGRAGIVLGYDHVCRRCKARGANEHTERHADAKLRNCSVCGMKRWPKAVPRPMRFHDLRHTTATLLLRAGVPMQHVQRILRHKNISVTVDLYGHLEVEDLRSAMSKLPALPAN